MSIVSLENIHKNYMLGKTVVPALRGIDLKIEKGALMSIVGPSGSGKTTLLNLVGCIDKASSGVVKIDGEDISNFTDNKLTDLRLFKIGFIFQSFNLIPVLSALENVEFPMLLMRKFSRKEIRRQAIQMMEEVEIGEYIEHKPAELSGGQRQRVAIARALVQKPHLVLADEPTANLDSVTGAKILEIMQKMNKQHNTTFIFSTHDPDVLKYAKTVVKIHDGKIVK
ncbi:ABC transporter ATP-binding protein [Candidatus Margulisiibacteriota bacterium]